MGSRTRMVIGAAMVVSVGCLGARSGDAQPFGIGASQAAEPTPFGVLSAPNGRFVFGQISASTKDQFMLDTATGRLWRIGESGKVGVFLKAVPYLNEGGEPTLLPDQVSPAERKRPEKKQSGGHN